MSHADKVLAALTDKGPMRMNALGKATKCSFISTVARQLEKAGKVRIDGKRNAIVYVPGQDVQDFKDREKDGAPQSEKDKKKKGKKSPRRAYRRVPLGTPEPAFIAAVTADTALVLIGKGPAPLVFTEEQTEKIATLMFAHFKG